MASSHLGNSSAWRWNYFKTWTIHSPLFLPWDRRCRSLSSMGRHLRLLMRAKLGRVQIARGSRRCFKQRWCGGVEGRKKLGEWMIDYSTSTISRKNRGLWTKTIRPVYYTGGWPKPRIVRTPTMVSENGIGKSRLSPPGTIPENHRQLPDKHNATWVRVTRCYSRVVAVRCSHYYHFRTVERQVSDNRCR